MADVVLDRTEDPALRSLADSISRTQRTEVKAMNAFRTKKYGGPVPNGGSEAPVEEEHGAEH